MRALSVRTCAPLGAPPDPLEEGDVVWFVARGLDERASTWDLCALLPEPDTLPPGTVLVVSPAVPRDGFFARLVRAEHAVPRGVRGSALLLKGYVAIGGGVDPDSGLDLAWGVVPG